MTRKICSVQYCGNRHEGLGFCKNHRRRFRQYGHPTGSYRALMGSVHDEVAACSAHLRCTRLWGKASEFVCIECGSGANDWAYDGTDATQLYGPSGGRSKVFYSRYPEFYMPLCRPCHNARDKALAAVELENFRTLKHRSGLTYEEMAEKLGVPIG